MVRAPLGALSLYGVVVAKSQIRGIFVFAKSAFRVVFMLAKSVFWVAFVFAKSTIFQKGQFGA